MGQTIAYIKSVMWQMLVCIQSSQLVFLQKKMYLDEYIHLESGSHYFWRKHRSKDYFNCLQSYRILWSNFRYTLITVPLSLVVPSKWSKVMHASIFWRHTALPVSTIEPPKKFCFFYVWDTHVRRTRQITRYWLHKRQIWPLFFFSPSKVHKG